MGRPAKYTDEQKAEALAIVAEHGQGEAARRTGIPFGTIGSWANRAGIRAPDSTATAVKTAHAIAANADRKTTLAHQLIEDADRLRQQLFAPCVDQVVKTENRGVGISRAVIVEVHREQPTFADQRHIVASITGLLDKALVMLGEATARVEQLTGEIGPRTPEVEAEVAKVLSVVRAA
jgi:transposase-like protein